MRALTERIGLSRSEIYRRIKAGTFPQTLSLGQRSVGWLESDIDAWIDALSQRGDA
ncbi:AlpA family phage regulatory protein [Paraburkholderia phenazinium]|jgi:prophage regulatory protein|uniref:AlpA family phage regulatory protein n=1 Tax=Paraburkholderia phenazinium TaxID=60549 RepID=UPI001588434C